jgi:hypothetical protein
VRPGEKKVCRFCKDKATYVDYKDTALLRKFISDRGKIRGRVTGNCVQPPANTMSWPLPIGWVAALTNRIRSKIWSTLRRRSLGCQRRARVSRL